jgi:hypothetical protein
MIRALLSLLLLTGPAWATSITIGELEYLSTSQGISGYKVIFNTVGVTAQPLTFANATLFVGGRHESIGPISTSTLPILFEGGAGLGLPACPCTSLRLKLLFPGSGPITFMLANGQQFTTSRMNVTLLLPTSGMFLMPGANAPIVLTAVPEPETWALMSTGLMAIWPYFRRRIRRKTHVSKVRSDACRTCKPSSRCSAVV